MALGAALMALVFAPAANATHTVDFTCSPANCTVEAGQSITLTATTDGSKPFGWKWDLDGDGTAETDSSSTPGDEQKSVLTHSYGQPGTYDVFVQVSASPGPKDDATSPKHTITVTPAPTTTTTTTTPTPPPNPTPVPLTPQQPPILPGGPGVQEDFDGLLEGTRLTNQIPGVAFPDEVIAFTPRDVAPFSFPRAVGNASCASALPTGRAAAAGASPSTIRMGFDTPTSAVVLEAGALGVGEARGGTWGRLVGYDSAGAIVADSGDVLIAPPGERAHVATPLQIAEANGRIASAAVFVGQGTASHDFGGQCAAIDNVVLHARVGAIIGPDIEISSPDNGEAFERPVFRVRGRLFDRGRGVRNFCVTATSRTESATFPYDCNMNVWTGLPEGLSPTPQRPPLLSDGTFDVAAPQLQRGENRITAWVRTLRNQEASASIIVNVTNQPLTYDLVVRGIEVTQGIQQVAIPPFDAFSPPTEGISHGYPFGRYQGVRLAAGGRTIVRVFGGAIHPANTSIGGPGGSGRLWGYRRDALGLRLLPGSPIMAEQAGPVHLSTTPTLEYAERSGEAYRFTLPAEWTTGTIRVAAEIVGPTSFRQFREVYPINNVGALDQVSFTPTRDYTVAPVRLVTREPTVSAPPEDPSAEFAAAKATMPLSDTGFHLLPFQGTIDVTPIARCNAADQAAGNCPFPRDRDWSYTGQTNGWDQRNHAPGQPYGLGRVGGGRTIGRYAMVNLDLHRPLTAVAHELWHLFSNIGHPGRTCTEGGENWPPDQRGYIQGVAVDRRPDHYGTTYGPNLDPARGPQFYDLLSYCASTRDYDSWTSTRSWTVAIDELRVGGPAFPGVGTPPARASRAASSSVRGARVSAAGFNLRVLAGVHEGTFLILGVERTDEPPTPAVAGSPYSLTVRDSAGAAVSVTPVALAASEHHPGTPVSGLFAAVIPAFAGASAVELASAGRVVATRRRSPAAPSLKLSALKTRRLRPGSALDLRWRASDADRDPLGVVIEYSRNNGRSWHVVHQGPSEGRAKIPAMMLGAASRARVRVLVNDGFSTTSAVSRTFRAPGTPPLVRILSPGRRFALDMNATLSLTGEAYDDASRSLRKRSLTWLDGKRRVGRGETASVSGLRPGSHRFTLVARDRLGRRSRASVRVKIRGVIPQFTILDGPARLGAKARQVTLRVASAVPAILQIGKRRYQVGRRPRKLRVAVKPGKSELVIAVTLRAFGKQRADVVRVPRGSSD